MGYTGRQWCVLALLFCLMGCQQTAPAPTSWADTTTMLSQRMHDIDPDSGFLSMRVTYSTTLRGYIDETTSTSFIDSASKAYCFTVEAFTPRMRDDCEPDYTIIPANARERQQSFQAFKALRIPPDQALAIALTKSQDFRKRYNLRTFVIGSFYPQNVPADNPSYTLSAYVWRITIVGEHHQMRFNIDPVTGAVTNISEEHASR